MAVNGKLKSLLPWLGAIITVLVILTTFSAKWGSTTEKVNALEKNQKRTEKLMLYELQKLENQNKQWRARDAEDRKRQDKLLQKMYDKLMED